MAWNETSRPTALAAQAETAARAICPGADPAQNRAAAAGSIIRPTTISVPNTWNPATRFSTTRPMNSMCTQAPRPPAARRKPGSRHSATSSRYASARMHRVALATAVTSSKAASSRPSTVPNSTCSKSMLEPRSETSSTPSPSDIK
ncbi:Uncharacterised protein [Bordetella pertussis]|nr:Uncharacterised protein [Bordetella pertussis]CPL70799.1 Uncharacterised protein [Bordetella pertussis]CPQ79275.1 Uncharacterised protein [Bordetella pertussis]CRE22864.1 Uncharacterised protein [Bordetella pertussis]